MKIFATALTWNGEKSFPKHLKTTVAVYRGSFRSKKNNSSVLGKKNTLIVIDRKRREQLTGGFTHTTESIWVEILQKVIIMLALAEEHQLFDRKSLICRSERRSFRSDYYF